MKKKIILVIIALLFVAGGIANCSDDGESPDTTSTKTDTTQQTETTESSDIESTSAETLDTTAEQSNVLTFTLIAGQAGEYGKYITYNAGTEFEEKFYGYFVPYGTYSVTNKGEYPTQVNVYSDDTVFVEGWEEPSEVGFVQRLEVGETITVTVAENQHIEITEPTIIELVFQSEETYIQPTATDAVTISVLETTTGATATDPATTPATQTQPPQTTPAPTETTEPPITTTVPVTTVPPVTTKSEPKIETYVLNTNTMKFHIKGCRHVPKIKDEHKDTYTGNHEDVIANGYSPCGTCNP